MCVNRSSPIFTSELELSKRFFFEEQKAIQSSWEHKKSESQEYSKSEIQSRSHINSRFNNPQEELGLKRRRSRGKWRKSVKYQDEGKRRGPGKFLKEPSTDPIPFIGLWVEVWCVLGFLKRQRIVILLFLMSLVPVLCTKQPFNKCLFNE